jgi:excisionase family DNA binding protein
MEAVRLLTVEEAAQRLSLKAKTLYAWVQQGRIGHVKLGRALRFREKDVEECIQRGTVDVRVA